jgi:hypothetical protein
MIVLRMVKVTDAAAVEYKAAMIFRFVFPRGLLEAALALVPWLEYPEQFFFFLTVFWRAMGGEVVGALPGGRPRHRRCQCCCRIAPRP